MYRFKAVLKFMILELILNKWSLIPIILLNAFAFYPAPVYLSSFLYLFYFLLLIIITDGWYYKVYNTKQLFLYIMNKGSLLLFYHIKLFVSFIFVFPMLRYFYINSTLNVVLILISAVIMSVFLGLFFKRFYNVLVVIGLILIFNLGCKHFAWLADMSNIIVIISSIFSYFSGYFFLQRQTKLNKSIWI